LAIFAKVAICAAWADEIQQRSGDLKDVRRAA
jgi:hypothetical protein